MPSSVYVNDRIESVTVAGSHADGVFDVRVTLKSGIFNSHRMRGGEILREYGAYLTVADRQQLANGHKHHWRCSVM